MSDARAAASPRATLVLGETFAEIRAPLRTLCAEYPGAYWRQLDRDRAYPEAFVTALTEAGYLAALIPEEFGGSGLGMDAGVAILEEIQTAGCNAAACHAQMYTMGTLLKHGSDAQKAAYLPKIASGGAEPPGEGRASIIGLSGKAAATPADLCWRAAPLI